MAPHISQVIRERMVVWSEEGIPCGEIANLAGCSLRSVYKILGYHRDYGTTQNPFAESTHGRYRDLDMGDINYIIKTSSKSSTMSVVVDLKLSE